MQYPKDDDDENTKGYESLCDETFYGWFFDGYQWGWYFGQKLEKEKVDNVKNKKIKYKKIVIIKL